MLFLYIEMTSIQLNMTPVCSKQQPHTRKVKRYQISAQKCKFPTVKLAHLFSGNYYQNKPKKHKYKELKNNISHNLKL